MFLFIFKISVLLCTLNKYDFVAGLENSHSARIIHGKEVKITEFPFYAGLFNCGAAILSESWVTTAAHCVDKHEHGTLPLLSVGGESFFNSKLVAYDKIVIHRHYRLKPTVNDIALLHLTEPLNFTDKIQPVQLPSYDDLKRPNTNTKLVFVGRGRDETGKLSRNIQKMEARRLSTQNCFKYLPYEIHREVRPSRSSLEKAVYCAQRVDGPAGLCFGDSGSPLMDGKTLVGLASFIPANNCEHTRLGFYVHVVNYVPWIKSVTGLK